MDSRKTKRMSLLFEKMTMNSATVAEQVELKALYQEYIYEGRDFISATADDQPSEKRYVSY